MQIFWHISKLEKLAGELEMENLLSETVFQVFHPLKFGGNPLHKNFPEQTSIFEKEWVGEVNAG